SRLIMRYLYILFFCCLVLPVWSQEELGALLPPGQAQTATIDMYRIITAQPDTTYVDTSLTIKSHYKHNYLRRDLFGLMPFANEGQPYTELQFSLKRQSVFPEFGRHAKHYSFVQPEDIRYYSVATPFTELYFK